MLVLGGHLPSSFLRSIFLPTRNIFKLSIRPVDNRAKTGFFVAERTCRPMTVNMTVCLYSPRLQFADALDRIISTHSQQEDEKVTELRKELHS